MHTTGINKFIRFTQLLISGLVLLNCLGWIFAANSIAWLGLEFRLMSLIAAGSLVLCVAALACIRSSGQLHRYTVHKVSIALSLAVMAMLSLMKALFTQSFPIPWGLQVFTAKVVIFPSMLTSILFFLSALAIFFSVSTNSKRNYVVQIIALIILLTVIMILAGHIDYAAQTEHISPGLDIPITTAIGLLFFSLAMFFSNPQAAISGYFLDQSIDESAQRFILPIVIVVPIAALLLARLLANVGVLGPEYQGVLAIMLIVAAFVWGVWFLRKFIENIETQFEMMANAAPVMMWMASSDGRATYFNKHWLEFTGRKLKDEMGIKFDQCVHRDDVEKAYNVYRKAFTCQTPFTLEYRLLRHDGQYRWILEKANPYRGIDGGFSGFIGSCADITEHKQASEKMQLVAHVFEHSAQGIIVTDAHSLVVMTNPAFKDLTGFSLDEILGKTPSYLHAGLHDDKLIEEIQDSLQQHQSWQGEIWNRRKNGELFLQELSINAVLDNHGKPVNYIGVFSDITQRKQNEEHYIHLAHFDLLTDLPNRVLLTDRIGQALFRAQRYGNRVAILFLDLNKFKSVNDEMGHHVGDLLLKEVAKRITACVRQEDTVSRLGGDEFVVLLTRVKGRKNVVSIAEKIIAVLSMPYHIEQFSFSNYPSIGIALYPEDGQEMKILLENADKAMYRVKQSNSLLYSFYQGKTVAETNVEK